jgi:hypothetical protein
MAISIKWKKVSETEWQGSTGYSEYRILKKPLGRGKYVYHGYKVSKYIAQASELEDCQLQVVNWIKAHS